MSWCPCFDGVESVNSFATPGYFMSKGDNEKLYNTCSTFFLSVLLLLSSHLLLSNNNIVSS